VKEATAGDSDEAMRAALDIDLPNYADVIVTTDEVFGMITGLWRSCL
jgi:ureidoacrylate peracid hydrolase